MYSNRASNYFVSGEEKTKGDFCTCRQYMDIRMTDNTFALNEQSILSTMIPWSGIFLFQLANGKNVNLKVFNILPIICSLSKAMKKIPSLLRLAMLATSVLSEELSGNDTLADYCLEQNLLYSNPIYRLETNIFAQPLQGKK